MRSGCRTGASLLPSRALEQRLEPVLMCVNRTTRARVRGGVSLKQRGCGAAVAAGCCRELMHGRLWRRR
jgi:hypothetical protein